MTTPQSALASRLHSIDLASLPISDYNRRYLERLLPVVDYYLDIYTQGLQQLLKTTGKDARDVTMVDYGGGHGILSLLAVEMGIGRVLYIDINPDSAHTFELLAPKVTLNTSNITILCGDTLDLRNYCYSHNILPDFTMGMDVIEHIYCLADFFSEIISVNPRQHMLFTTASNPFNRRIVRRLHKEMTLDEFGDPNRHDPYSRKGFLNVRREYIAEHFPDLSSDQLDYWAKNTRGLCFEDILRAVESESPILLLDPYNTCNPATRSWTERILPISDYENLLRSYGYTLQVVNGFYNSRNRGIKGLVQRRYNRKLMLNKSRSQAPFLFLYASPR